MIAFFCFLWSIRHCLLTTSETNSFLDDDREISEFGFLITERGRSDMLLSIEKLEFNILL